MPDRYRAVFEKSPDFVKMVTTNRKLVSLRAYLCSVQTEYHVDLKDWEGGYAWMTPFGEFTGWSLGLLHNRQADNL